MSAALDTSVVLASLDADEPEHEACASLLVQGGHYLYAHALAEAYSILTGRRRRQRVDGDVACQLLNESVLPFVEVINLGGKEVMKALRQGRERGVRGGAVYDFLHLVAARKAGAARLCTLDRRNFQALARPGDPDIAAPTP